MDVVAFRHGEAPIVRGSHLAQLGANSLERLLYERDEMREREARRGACDICKLGQHDCCLRTAHIEHYQDAEDAPPLPGCTCPDCALGIPEAAADPFIPPEVWNDVVATLPARQVGGGR